MKTYFIRWIDVHHERPELTQDIPDSGEVFQADSPFEILEKIKKDSDWLEDWGEESREFDIYAAASSCTLDEDGDWPDFDDRSYGDEEYTFVFRFSDGEWKLEEFLWQTWDGSELKRGKYPISQPEGETSGVDKE